MKNPGVAVVTAGRIAYPITFLHFWIFPSLINNLNYYYLFFWLFGATYANGFPHLGPNTQFCLCMTNWQVIQWLHDKCLNVKQTYIHAFGSFFLRWLVAYFVQEENSKCFVFWQEYVAFGLLNFDWPIPAQSDTGMDSITYCVSLLASTNLRVGLITSNIK